MSKARVKDLKEANLALTQAKDFSDRGILFEANVISWLSMVVVTVTNASFAHETIQEPMAPRSHIERRRHLWCC